MLARLVICSAFGLLLAFLALFLFGHRLRRGHWFVSLSLIASIAALAWWLQDDLIGNAPPLDRTVGFALLAGAIVTATFERWNALAHACFTAVVLAVGLYLSYAAFVLSAAHLGPWSLGFGLVLFVLQFTSMALLLVITFEILDALCRMHWQHSAHAKRVPGYEPKVSLHVPVHREPPEMVIETLNAIARLDYKNYEVLVIDNNTDDEELWRPVAQHCDRLGKRFRFFHLLPWPGYKSGALNFALAQTSPDAEIIGIVDADYQVDANWLADLTGHFADRQISFVQTPQDYRDTKSRGFYGKVLALAYIYFFRISMVSRNEHNAIIFAGTMGLLRRSALEEVGGWDEWCITEDAEVSLRLLKAGYRSLYVNQTYGRGVMPLDYAGLKKQRFRWAFGGMQLLRMHAGELFNPWAKGKLTFAQRWAYLSGALQWLNDPLALAFTVLLFIGGSAYLVGGTFAVQPFVGAVIFVPPMFVLFAIARFLWALRVREHCSVAEALGALAVLLGLTWVVTLACARGLVSRQGVFLRTPKQGGMADIGHSLAIVRWESLITVACIGLVVTMMVNSPDQQVSGRAGIILLLCWQAAIYGSAVLTSAWDYQQRRGRSAPRRLGFRTVGHEIGRRLSERQTAGWVALVALVLGQLLYLASERAPTMERVFRADPLRQFLPAPAALSATAEQQAGALLVLESEAALRGDVEKALSLWSPEGVIVDENFSPGYTEDDRVWQGRNGLRERYSSEFKQRRYLSIRHLNLDIKVKIGYATIINDLDAVVQSDRLARGKRVHLLKTDRWLVKQVDGRWEIVRLELNRAPQAVSAKHQGDGDENKD